MKKALLIAFLIFPFVVSSQDNNPLVNAKEVLQKGYEYISQKEYGKAIDEYLKISRNDTSYITAMMIVTGLYAEEKKDSLTVLLCDDLLKDQIPQRNKVLIAKANAYDNMKKYDLAEKTYMQAEKECPNDYLSYFNHGLMYQKQDKYDKADELYIKALRINLYHTSSLYRLAQSQIKQGKVSTAMMALQFMLLLDNTGERASSALAMLEQLVKGELDDDMTHKRAYDENDDFTELDEIIKSKLAISEKYKSKTKLNYAVTKQVQVFHEKIKVKKNSTGFFMTYLAPYFEGIQKNGFLEPLQYTMLAGANIDNVNKWMKSNETKLKKLAVWTAELMLKTAFYYEDDLNGERIKCMHYFEDGQLSAVGNKSDKGEYIGYWKFYHDIYTIKSEGMLTGGKKNGKWKFYYSNGILSEEAEFKDGLFNGLVTDYHPIGTRSLTVNYEMGVPKGLVTIYNSAGQKTNEFTLENNLKEGKVKTFYTTGTPEVEIDYVKGKGEGKYLVYYESGNLKEQAAISNDARNGETIGYLDNNNKQVDFKGFYKNNEAVGEWKYYNEKGGITSEGVFDERGKKNGKWKAYHKNGKLAGEYEYSKGNFDGPYKVYDTTGTLFATYEYKNGNIKAFNITHNGKVLASGKESGKELMFEDYSPYGNKKAKGKYVNGLEEGKWEFYNHNGYMTTEANYKEGKLEGNYTRYYANGKISEVTPHKNDMPDGYSKSYYTNEKISEEGWFVEGNREGFWLVYWPDGELKSKYYYLTNDLHGWQVHYAVNGKIAYEEKYDRNKLVGVVYYDTLSNEINRTFLLAGTGETVDNYPNGNPRVRINYKGGEAEGKVEWLYANKQVETSGAFVNGERHGAYVSYYSDGTKSNENNYEFGKKHGKGTDYYRNGNKREELTYERGKIVGTWYSYHENGKVSREGQYVKGDSQGHIKLYDELGVLMVDRIYDEDVLLRINTYGADQKPQKIEIKNETAKVVGYYANGKKAIEVEYKNGVIEGKRTTYHSTGKVFEDETFVCAEEEGPGKRYYANGNLHSEYTMLDGSYHGKVITKYENGAIKSIEYFKYGSLHGKCRYYNEKGELTTIRVYYNDHLFGEEKVK